MVEALWLCLAILAALLGMGWLALSMDAHWRQVMEDQVTRSAGQVSFLRLAGALGLITAFVCCLQADHPSMAVLVWVMLLAVSAFCVALVLTWQSHWLQYLVLRMHRKA